MELPIKNDGAHICSMYGTYTFTINFKPNISKYSIHGASGVYKRYLFLNTASNRVSILNFRGLKLGETTSHEDVLLKFTKETNRNK